MHPNFIDYKPYALTLGALCWWALAWSQQAESWLQVGILTSLGALLLGLAWAIYQHKAAEIRIYAHFATAHLVLISILNTHWLLPFNPHWLYLQPFVFFALLPFQTAIWSMAAYSLLICILIMLGDDTVYRLQMLVLYWICATLAGVATYHYLSAKHQYLSLARRNDLTGLLDAHQLQEDFNRELNRAAREQTLLACVYVRPRVHTSEEVNTLAQILTHNLQAFERSYHSLAHKSQTDLVVLLPTSDLVQARERVHWLSQLLANVDAHIFAVLDAQQSLASIEQEAHQAFAQQPVQALSIKEDTQADKETHLHGTA
ncbi:hypothetical protein SAMN05421831_10791 [Allopseudospirillum japonicum]|uniref:GGDEF domain-containing protein, diguanylate cyclase (C-di-GMP synthetase) or its enzymatically inactive variants n=1 Tax=Allopseudospirillum japonicum TaxID=64971 RepID=A0A1H6SU00_9GAMM|nr:hypothetical protein [Allopseudospirillum japonicum]SEI68247.1 hypothetical protein SAMN05421831_10791 [Allopseudospirillum japonicum]